MDSKDSVLSPDDSFWRNATILVAFLFLFKTAYLALCVTPLWDVPDETGHLAYVMDVADGRNILGKDQRWIPAEIISDWRGRPSPPEPNWIASHPPLYYVAAAPFLIAGRALTRDREQQYRATRLAGAVAGAATILLLFFALQAAGHDARFAFLGAACLSVLPMFSHLAAGVSHDVTLALAMTLAGWCWVRFEREGRWRDALWTGAAMGLAGTIKLSAPAVLLPMVLFALAGLPREEVRKRFWKPVAIGVLGLLPAVLWAIRSAQMPAERMVDEALARGTQSLWWYLDHYPVAEHTVRNFVGLVGWTGSGGGELRWLQISRWSFLPFALAGMAMTAGALLWCLELALRSRNAPGVARAGVVGVWLVALLGLSRLFGGGEPAGAFIENIWYAALFTLPVFSLMLVGTAFPVRERLILKSLGVSGAFTLAYAVNSWNAYRMYGMMRATHGRYFFAILPFLALGLLYPAWLILQARAPRLARWWLALPLLLAIAEGWFFLRDVIPFYQAG